MFIRGEIIELRTSADGDYDWTKNCWVADELALVTDRGTYIFRTAGRDCSEWSVERAVAVDKAKYPCVLRNFSGRSLSYKSYVESDGWTNLTLYYEDAFLWLSPAHGCTMLSLHGYDGNTDEVLKKEFTPRSLYIAWDREDDYYCIEFDTAAC